MPDHLYPYLTRDNLRYAAQIERREDLFRVEPSRLFPLFWPCTVRVLIVTDGGLDFSLQNFGLSTFVTILLDTPSVRVDFSITLAHINNVTSAQMLDTEPRIAARITSFRFDDPAHFDPNDFDEVWLFGISTFYSGRGTSPATGLAYPTDRLADSELAALAGFMNGGGGLFATGDHGALGVCLSGSVMRARSMRLWKSTSMQDAFDEVSMGGPRRNDTNRSGDPGTQFNDQSDDIPQTISPKFYSAFSGFWRYRFPHPVLCGPNGPIRVLPDHPHEGECIQAADPDATYSAGGFSAPEYPFPGDGSPRPLPEVIATSTVPAGNTAEVGGTATKLATVAQSFGAISAYDGHRAGVGRVVTDATWHHFVNVNLIGELGASGVKSMGFLASASGQAHFDSIKAYYRNIAVWIASPERHRCFSRRLPWVVIYNDRVMEAIMTRADIPLERLSNLVIFEIGRHARDAMGRYAGQCQTRSIIIDWIKVHVDLTLIPEIDPWWPWPEPPEPPPPDPAPWVDLEPIFDFALGSALVAIRDKFPEPDEKALAEVRDTDVLDEIVSSGIRDGLSRAFESLGGSLERAGTSLRYLRNGGSAEY